MFSLSELPSPGDVVIVTDQLLSPADFVIHKTISSHFKDVGKAKCLFLSVSESLARLKAIAAKSNVNLAQHLQSGSFAFVDVGSYIEPPIDRAHSSHQTLLRPLFDLTSERLSEWSDEGATPLVVLDNISALEWIGFPVSDILRFLRALSALCRKSNVALLIRHHVATPAEPDDITRLLYQLGTYHLEVLPLSTGRSGSVSGQIALHPGPGISQPVQRPIPRSSAVQYRLTDTSVVFFERGTGSTVL
ncbi:unnamed protein product [Somion occarium]